MIEFSLRYCQVFFLLNQSVRYFQIQLYFEDLYKVSYFSHKIYSFIFVNCNSTMSFDLPETSSPSSIAVSDAPISPSLGEVTDHVGKTVRDHFFKNIELLKEKNSWEATCIICNSTIRGTKGVTSNFNRHIKDFHASQYESWQNKIQQDSPTQKKITDSMAVEKIKHTRASNAMYSSNHPRQIELQKSIIEDLIVELGLPLSLVERQGFLNFMNRVDPQFKMISRRSIARTAIPSLYKKMMDGLQMFCASAECVSLTLDIWSDRRQRAFFAVTGKIENDNRRKLR